jgi:Polyketide cyclase / dehydrase and lipid transport
MARSYYSVMLYHPADEVWAVIRPFDHYAWAGVESETIIEHGKAADQVGAVRRVSFGGNVIRQVLLAHSDIEHSYSYAFCGAPPFPVQDYVATIRVTPIVADGAAFVEWWATFDCAAEDRDKWVRHFAQEGFAKWLAALRYFLSDGGVRADRRSRARTCLA